MKVWGELSLGCFVRILGQGRIGDGVVGSILVHVGLYQQWILYVEANVDRSGCFSGVSGGGMGSVGICPGSIVALVGSVVCQ